MPTPKKAGRRWSFTTRQPDNSFAERFAIDPDGAIVDGTLTLTDEIGTGSSTLNLGTNAPGSVSPATPLKYALITIDGGQYCFPLWRVNSSGDIPTSGLAAWFKADIGVTLSGTDVTAWADQSGNGFDLTATATNPTFNSADINSQPSISTDTGQQLVRAANLIGSGADRDVFAVARQGNSGGYAVCSFGDGSTGGFGCNYESLGGGARYVWVQNISGGNDAYFIRSGDETAVPHFHRWTLDSGALSYALDGTDVGALTYDGSFVNDGASALFTVGGLNAGIPSRPWTGSIAEVIVYNRVLTGPEVAQVNSYLSGKYAL